MFLYEAIITAKIIFCNKKVAFNRAASLICKVFDRSIDGECNEPSRVIWCGDYADEPDDFNFPNCSAFYVPHYEEVWGDSVSAIGVSSTDFTLDGKFLLNHDTKQFIDLDAYKAACTDKHGWCIPPLPLLTAVGNDRGFTKAIPALNSSDFGLGNLFPLPIRRLVIFSKSTSDSLRRAEEGGLCRKSPKNSSKSCANVLTS